MSSHAPQKASAAVLAIYSVAGIVGATLGFLVLALSDSNPTAPDLELAQNFLYIAVALGIAGRLLGRLLLARAKLEDAADFAQFVQRSFVPITLSFSTRQTGVLLCGLSVRFGGQIGPASAIAGILVLTMLVELRTPGRLRRDFDLARSRRTL